MIQATTDDAPKSGAITPAASKDRVYLSIDRRGVDGGLQVSINVECEGGGHGYRIAGPKYDGSGRTLLKHYITSRDVTEIRSYLAKANL